MGEPSAAPPAGSTLPSRALAWWAKLGPRDSPIVFHPVWCHALDSAAVARLLWREVLGRRVRGDLAAAAGLSDEQAGCWFEFLAAAHDIGKVSPAFQAKAHHPRWQSAMADAGTRAPLVGALPHGIASQRALREWATAALSASSAKTWAAIVGGHHGIFPSPTSVSAATSDLMGTGGWHHDRVALLAELFGAVGAEWPAAEPRGAAALTFAGLLTVADWLASDERFFPYAYGLEEQVSPADFTSYLTVAESNAARALRRTAWMSWDAPRGYPSFAAMFPAIRALRPLQSAMLELPDDQLSSPGLIVVEAPMGEGKTEAALHLAARWNACLGRRGLYVALPTQATSNQMYGRVKDAVAAQVEGQAAPYLLHGFASFHPDFAAILAERDIVPSGIGEGNDDAPQVSAWFTGRKRGLLATYAVGTIDQVMMAALQARHVTVRLSGLAGRVVVLDEVHAYDTYMTTIIERLLEWLAALHAPVFLLSATLPRARREALCRAYLRGAGAQPQPLEAVHYPRLTTVVPANNRVHEIHVAPSQIREVAVEWLDDQTAGALTHSLRRGLDGGGCALVVCNTVSRAQQVFTELGADWQGLASDGHPRLELLHARFPQRVRLEREARLLERFSRDRTRPEQAVVVATQVVEQSLDVDFDILVTDLAPIDLLLQRLGRIHRHVRPRPPGCQTPRIVVRCAEAGPGGLPDLDPGSARVYAPHVLWRSWLALRRLGPSIALPFDIEALIEEVYAPFDDANAVLPEQGLRQLITSWDDLRSQEAEEVEQARSRYMKPPVADLRVWEFCPEPLDDDEDPRQHPQLRALTRMGPPSVRVACLSGGVTAACPGDGRPAIDLGRDLSRDDTMRLLLSTVVVQHQPVVRHLLQAACVPSFRSNAWLRHVRPVFFNDDHMAVLGAWQCQLDPDLGLVISKSEA